MDNSIKLNINGFNITIIIEKEYKEDTPTLYTPIQYHEFNIKRIYKTWISTKSKLKKYNKPISTLVSSQSDKIVKQEPLLDFH